MKSIKTALPPINIRVNRIAEKMINLRLIDVRLLFGLIVVGVSFSTKYSLLKYIKI